MMETNENDGIIRRELYYYIKRKMWTLWEKWRYKSKPNEITVKNKIFEMKFTKLGLMADYILQKKT